MKSLVTCHPSLAPYIILLLLSSFLQSPTPTKIPLHKIDLATTLLTSHTIPTQTFSQDWYSNPPKHKATFKIAYNDEFLLFHFKAFKKPTYDPTKQLGEFHKGLWEQDIAEIFLKSPDSPTYQEFNFSPTGAYWSALFTDYRQLAKEVPLHPESICSTIEDNAWAIEFKIPLKHCLLQNLEDTEVQLNVCSILYDGDTTFLSYVGGEGAPDFHGVELYGIGGKR